MGPKNPPSKGGPITAGAASPVNGTKKLSQYPVKARQRPHRGHRRVLGKFLRLPTGGPTRGSPTCPGSGHPHRAARTPSSPGAVRPRGRRPAVGRCAAGLSVLPGPGPGSGGSTCGHPWVPGRRWRRPRRRAGHGRAAGSAVPGAPRRPATLGCAASAGVRPVDSRSSAGQRTSCYRAWEHRGQQERDGPKTACIRRLSPICNYCTPFLLSCTKLNYLMQLRTQFGSEEDRPAEAARPISPRAKK